MIAYGKGAATLAEDLELFLELKTEYEAKIASGLIRKMPSIEKVQKEAVDKAQGLLNAWFGAYPDAKAWLDWAAEQPFEKGYSVTLLGRKRYYKGVDRSKVSDDEARKAEASIRNQGKNSPIQGSNADITKIAMVRVANQILANGYDAMIVNVIHDELLVEVLESQAVVVGDMVSVEMIAAAQMLVKRVPIVAAPKIADRWEK